MAGLTLPSYYHTYQFISPSSLYAEIKEEMKSYFATGVVDDTMFPIYTRKALEKLQKAGYKIDEAVLELENGAACLPDNFRYVREVWACITGSFSVAHGSSTYHSRTYLISPQGDFDSCNPCSCPENCDRKFRVLEKTTGNIAFSFDHSYRLKPGGRNAFNHCAADCQWHEGHDTFDIRDGKIITAGTEGIIHLVYYKREYDQDSYELIPDNYRISEYIKAFIKFKVYEQIFNEVSDESFNQAERKYQLYKQEYTEAFIMADAEVKKQTLQQKANSYNAASRRMNKFIIR
ncbi:hypothetical protein HGH93_21395 [Chitinophaga polysaccharea]|uniref:hypothetical protein n=1 Tax=Chitinophaga polysaccharea TaxID=1293035 RepID=UPI0014554875|nr:hypothetical protein [Chitinophaga polysaccharea]NLR60679.1 hypothetical protein [Chitinophaga polysaccharea]